MNNLGSIISKHNKQILNQDRVEVVPPCNCDKWPIQGYTGCPLENQQCKKEAVIYNCKVSSEGGTEIILVLQGGQLKPEFHNIQQISSIAEMKPVQHCQSISIS